MTGRPARCARPRDGRGWPPMAALAALVLLSCGDDPAGPAPPPPLPTSVDSDRAALVALYESTDGPNWVNSENWLTDAPLGEWYGVDTDRSGRVRRLDLSGRGDGIRRPWVSHGLSGPDPPVLQPRQPDGRLSRTCGISASTPGTISRARSRRNSAASPISQPCWSHLGINELLVGPDPASYRNSAGSPT